MRSQCQIQARTHCPYLTKVDRLHKVFNDFVAMCRALLAGEDTDGVHIRPSSLDALAAGSASAARQVQVKAPLTIFAMRANVELRDDEDDLDLRIQIEEVTI